MKFDDKKIISYKDHTRNIMDGLVRVADPVCMTHGPYGKNVFIERPYLPPLVTKDGATVADYIKTTDDCMPIINLVRQATKKAADTTGDGTTTTTLLIYEMFSAYLEEYERLKKSNDSLKIRKSKVVEYMKYITETIVNILHQKAIKTKSYDDLKNIAYISTNQDRYMTELIMSAYPSDDTAFSAEELKNYEIFVNVSRSGEDYVEIIDGSKYEGGYLHGLFCNNRQKNKVEVENPLVMISSEKIYNMQDLAIPMKIAKDDNRHLVIICPEMDQDVLATVLYNYTKGNVKVSVLRAPGSGGTDTEAYLSDIGVLCGCPVLAETNPFTLKNVTPSSFGNKVKFIRADAESFTIVSDGNEEEMKERLEELVKEIQEAKQTGASSFDLEKRLKKLTSTVSNIYLAANSDVELFERKDRMDDAIGAIKSAIEEGYLAGCGISLIAALKEFEEKVTQTDEVKGDINYQLATTIIFKTLIMPFLKINANAETSGEASAILSDISFDNLIGIDLDSGKTVNLLEMNIIDPVKVVRYALQTAMSVVGTLILSDASILLVDRRETES